LLAIVVETVWSAGARPPATTIVASVKALVAFALKEAMVLAPGL